MWMAKSFKWKFTNFSIHPSLILQKHFLTHVNLVKHLEASIITTALFFCTQQMLSPVVRCMLALMEIAFVSTTSIVSLSKGCLLSFPSVLTKLYLTSISKVGSRLYTRKNGEKFVEVCLITLSANKTPSIILNQSHGLPSKTLTKFFFFWYTYSVVPIWLRMIHRSYKLLSADHVVWNFANFIHKLLPLVYNLNLHPLGTYNLILMKELSNGGGTFVFLGFISDYLL